MNPEIIQWLTSHPEVHNVYFRADGSWCFEPRLGYDKVVSREEATNSAEKEVKESKQKPLKNNN